MLKIILLLAVAAYFYFRIKPRSGGRSARSIRNRTMGRIDDVLEKDPVCGVYVAKGSGIRLDRDGKTHYFCSVACRDRFIASKDAKCD